ncbi:MAG: hypothetical protein K0S32_3916 [Bacteroidetes bacterium]|jgi:hypothetical protein|nr:hypothetical protein [Bacteroidota bacterium]
MKTRKQQNNLRKKSGYIKLLDEKLRSVMPEVHRQVKVYEEKLRSGKLTAPPKNNPLFSE